MRYSIFSVNDHHPRLPRTVPQLYAQLMAQCELGEALGYDDHVFTLHTYVAGSDDEAREQAKEAYDLYVDTRLYAKKHVYEDILANGICLFGSVETVADKVRGLHDI